MKINVTAEDIREGLRGDCFRCPIALAIKRDTGFDCDVYSPEHIFLGDGPSIIRNKYRPVEKDAFVVADFIDSFDNQKPVEPFTFELEKAE